MENTTQDEDWPERKPQEPNSTHVLPPVKPEDEWDVIKDLARAAATGPQALDADQAPWPDDALPSTLRLGPSSAIQTTESMTCAAIDPNNGTVAAGCGDQSLRGMFGGMFGKKEDLGKLLVWRSVDGALRLAGSCSCSAGEWKEQRKTMPAAVSCVSFVESAAGSVAVGCEDGSVKVYRIGDADPELLLDHPLHTGKVVEIIPTGEGTFVTAGADCAINIVELRAAYSHYALATLCSQVSFAHPRDTTITALAFDAAQRIGYVSTMASVQVLKQGVAAKEFETLGRHEWHQGSVRCMMLNSVGSVLFTGGFDMSIAVVSVSCPEQPVVLQKLLQHKASVTRLGYCMAANALLSTDARGRLLIWDLKSYQVMQDVNAHPGHEIHSLRFDNFAKRAVSAGSDNCVRVWSVDLAPHLEQISQLITHADMESSLEAALQGSTEDSKDLF